MELLFLLADTCKKTSETWRLEIYNLAEQKDLEYKLYTVNCSDAWNIIPEEEMKMMSLAFINIDMIDSGEIGDALYTANPFCRIIYFGNGKKDLKHWLPSRPVNYIDISDNDFNLENCIEDEYKKLMFQKGVYVYEDKFHNLCIPYSGILYFTVRDRMAYCMTVCGEKGPIRKNIDMIESEVEKDCFIRCHKSFLVSKRACLGFDKSRKEILLNNDETVSVSRAYWKEIVENFC